MADLPAMPFHTLQTLTDDPHLKAVKLIDTENHPTEGKIAVIRSTIQIDGAYPSARAAAVPCGWDTNDLMETLGYSATEIETLIIQKAVYSYGK
jgi:crotonobetainyl-CoA:carnitine CoA-transferase CaiB-like acyl-CoA transferase